jgi:hypothetical protein
MRFATLIAEIKRPPRSRAPHWIAATPSVTLAENIIALIILPKLPEKDVIAANLLSPRFAYDSTDRSTAKEAALYQLPPWFR